jgi:hypothetical protein
MRRIVSSALHTILITALAGCTGLAFKQGAGGEDFRRAEAECLSTTSERSAFFQCMDGKGWWARSMEELSQLGFASVDDEEAEDRPTPLTHAQPADTPVSNDIPGAEQARATQPSPTRTAPARPAAPKDPRSRITIAMWAKAGADGTALMASQAACLSALGSGHEPDPVAKTVTRGLYDCLRKDGWVGMTLR